MEPETVSQSVRVSSSHLAADPVPPAATTPLPRPLDPRRASVLQPASLRKRGCSACASWPPHPPPRAHPQATPQILDPPTSPSPNVTRSWMAPISPHFSPSNTAGCPTLPTSLLPAPCCSSRWIHACLSLLEAFGRVPSLFDLCFTTVAFLRFGVTSTPPSHPPVMLRS